MELLKPNYNNFAKPRDNLKYICRRNANDTNPKCDWCYYKNECDGEVIAVKNHYTFSTCPDRLDLGNKPQTKTHAECRYCKDYPSCCKGIFTP